MEHHTDPRHTSQNALIERMMRLEEDIELIAAKLRIERRPSDREHQPEVRDVTPQHFVPIQRFDRAAPFDGDTAHAARQERIANATRARRIISERRRRERTLGSELFADPAWDMLLDLYAAHHERRNVSVSSLCIAAAVPATTALRWIKTMTDKGMLWRAADANDGRRIYISLADHVLEAMDEFLAKGQDVPLDRMPI